MQSLVENKMSGVTILLNIVIQNKLIRHLVDYDKKMYEMRFTLIFQFMKKS